MQLEVKYGQAIFDAAILCYQDASRVYDLILENPQIENINSELTGMILNYTPSVITEKEVIKTVSVAQKDVIVGSMQSLFDISLQYYGSAEYVYDVVLKNNLENISSDPTGINLVYETKNTLAPIYYRKNGITIATKPLKYSPVIVDTNFILRADGGGLLRVDGGRFPEIL